MSKRNLSLLLVLVTLAPLWAAPPLKAKAVGGKAGASVASAASAASATSAASAAAPPSKPPAPLHSGSSSGHKTATSSSAGSSSGHKSSTSKAASGSSSNARHINLVTAKCPVPTLPSSFQLQELFDTVAHDMVVQTKDGISMGQVVSHPFNFHSLRTWIYPTHDNNQVGTFIAQSHRDIITTITEVFINDCHDQRLGSFRELFHHHKSAVSQFVIESPKGDQVAKSQMTKNFGTTIEIYDERGRRLVTMSKPWLQIVDRWTVDMSDHNTTSLATDPRMIVMIMANSTADGYWGMGGAVFLVLLGVMFACCCCCCLCAHTKRSVHRYEQVQPTPKVEYHVGYGT